MLEPKNRSVNGGLDSYKENLFRSSRETKKKEILDPSPWWQTLLPGKSTRDYRFDSEFTGPLPWKLVIRGAANYFGPRG